MTVANAKLCIVALALLVTCPVAVPAMAQLKLSVVGQQVRSQDVELSPETLAWNLEVQDLCETTVKKQLVRLPCSPWRPLVPVDVDRKPHYKGEIELPDGSTKNLLGRRGPAVSGEKHEVTLRLTTEQQDEAGRRAAEHRG